MRKDGGRGWKLPPMLRMYESSSVTLGEAEVKEDRLPLAANRAVGLSAIGRHGAYAAVRPATAQIRQRELILALAWN